MALPHCYLRRSTDTTVTGGVDNFLTWNSEVEDDHGYFNTGVSTASLVVPASFTPQLHVISCGVLYNQNGVLQLELDVNNVRVAQKRFSNAGTAAATLLHIRVLSAGDAVRVNVRPSLSGSVLAGGDPVTFFAITRLAPARARPVRLHPRPDTTAVRLYPPPTTRQSGRRLFPSHW